MGRQKTRIEGLHANPPEIGAAWTHQFFIRLHTIRFPKFLKPPQKQSVAASNIQDPQSSLSRQPASHHFQHSFLSRPPPPVPLVELAVMASVFFLQLLTPQEGSPEFPRLTSPEITYRKISRSCLASRCVRCTLFSTTLPNAAA